MSQTPCTGTTTPSIYTHTPPPSPPPSSVFGVCRPSPGEWRQCPGEQGTQGFPELITTTADFPRSVPVFGLLLDLSDPVVQGLPPSKIYLLQTWLGYEYPRSCGNKGGMVHWPGESWWSPCKAIEPKKEG